MLFLSYLPARRVVFVTICALSILAASATFYLWRKETAEFHLTLPGSLHSQLLFKPLLPGQLPDDYQIQSSSFQTQESVLIFTAFNSKGDVITFSEQASPRDFDYNRFYQDKISNPTKLATRATTSVFGKARDGDRNTLLSVVSDNVWVIVTLPASISNKDATIIAQNLHE